MNSAGLSGKWSLINTCYQAGIAAALIFSLSGLGQAAESKTIKVKGNNEV
jgi:hypothetical protein